MAGTSGIAPAETRGPGLAPPPPQRNDEILATAAHRHTPIIITRKAEGGWRVFQGKLTGAEPATRRLTAVLQPVDAERPAGGLSAGENVGVTFRRAHKKCIFSTRVVHVVESPEPTLDMEWPRRLQELQRRVFERTTPPAGQKVTVKFWRTADMWEEQVQPGCTHEGTLEDISVGGIRVRAAGAQVFNLEEPFVCRIDLGGHEEYLTLDAVLRHQEAPQDNASSLGLRFIGLETTEGGRQTMIRLARVVNRFQRRNSNAARIRLHRRRRAR